MSLNYFKIFAVFFVFVIRNFRSINLELLKREEIALFQFDSRPLNNYWLTSALWNNKYAKRHNHTFVYYNINKDCVHDNEKLASPWCKVKAMLQVDRDFPNVKVFIYMDSDAVVNRKYANTPVNDFLKLMQIKLNWDPNTKPLVFNQDGACWWCSLVQRVGYSVCLNAGTVLWYRHPASRRILQEWWDASMDPELDGNPIKRRFRLKWPWEQDRQMAVYNKSSSQIQIASQPDRMYQSSAQDWCLSHLPVAGCFIQHFCENKSSKRRMMKLYSAGNDNYNGNAEQLNDYGITVRMLD